MVHKSARRIQLGIAVAFCALALARNVGAQDMNTAIDKAVRTYDTVKTARGTMAQTNTSAMGTVSNLTADFQQQFPSLLSVRYSAPKGDMLIGDGKFTWVYFPNSVPGKVRKFEPGAGVGNINLIGVFLASPRTKYTLSDSGRQTVDGLVTRAVGLVPKQPMPEFRRATVWIEEATGIIRQFEFTDPSGAVRRIKFATLRVNVPVDASQFKFTVPRGVTVEGG